MSTGVIEVEADADVGDPPAASPEASTSTVCAPAWSVAGPVLLSRLASCFSEAAGAAPGPKAALARRGIAVRKESVRLSPGDRLPSVQWTWVQAADPGSVAPSTSLVRASVSPLSGVQPAGAEAWPLRREA